MQTATTVNSFSCLVGKIKCSFFFDTLIIALYKSSQVIGGDWCISILGCHMVLYNRLEDCILIVQTTVSLFLQGFVVVLNRLLYYLSIRHP